MTAQGASGTGSHWAGRPWQALHDLSDRTPLRTKLITALLALVAVALVAISVSSGWVLRSYLTTQDDNQLQAIYSGIVSNGRNYLLRGWWISGGPGIAIMTTVVAVNLLGDTLRDVLDPRLRSLTNL